MTFTQVGRGGTYFAVSGDSLPTDDILPNSVVYLTDIQHRKLFDGSSWVELPSPTVIALEDSEITASVSELNTLDGITATAAELNTMDGITSSTAELNKLDGASANVTAANLNTLTGGGATTLHSHAGFTTGDLIFDDPTPTSDPEVDRHVYTLNGVLMVSNGPV